MKKLLTATTLVILPFAAFAQPEGGSDMFKVLDANNDGAVSMKEAEAYQPVLNQFETLDINKDGQLSVEEFEKVQE